MKYIKFLFPILESFKTTFNMLKETFSIPLKYDYFSHIGLFILYNSFFIAGMAALMVMEFVFGDLFKSSPQYGQVFIDYFYDGKCIIGGNPMWRVHLALNILIFFYVYFKLKD